CSCLAGILFLSFWAGRALFLGSIIFITKVGATDLNLAAPGWHKIQVSDPALTAQITAVGGRLIADYGGYQLYASPQITADLQNPGAVELRDAYNSILLNVGPLDTSTPQAQTLRTTRGNFAGKRLHLVQFAGPVQPAWWDELVNAGVQVVTYVPHNAYLV